jgi:hypothetical protein
MSAGFFPPSFPVYLLFWTADPLFLFETAFAEVRAFVCGAP